MFQESYNILCSELLLVVALEIFVSFFLDRLSGRVSWPRELREEEEYLFVQLLQLVTVLACEFVRGMLNEKRFKDDREDFYCHLGFFEDCLRVLREDGR